MPSLYTILYILGALYALILSERSDKISYYVAFIVLLFFSYGAKETNVFFYPGIGLIELLRRRWTHLTIVISLSVTLLAAETLVVHLLLWEPGVRLGRLHAVLIGPHLSAMEQYANSYTYWDLVRRWGFHNTTESLNKLVYLSFFAVEISALCCRRQRTQLLSSAGAVATGNRYKAAATVAATALFSGGSFALFTTVFVVSLSPLKLGQPLNDRYLWPLLAPATLFLAWFIHNLPDTRTRTGGKRFMPSFRLICSTCANR